MSTTPLSREAYPVLLRQLVEAKARGDLTAHEIATAAELAGRHPRTVRRWVERGEVPHNPRTRYEACSRDLEAIFEARGRLAAAHRKRLTEDPMLPPISTWARAIHRELRGDEIAFARLGERGRRNLTAYLQEEPEAPNSVWEADHHEMKVQVVGRRGHHPQRPWITAFIDCHTRAVVGYLVSLQPGEAEVRAGFYRALVKDDSWGPFGGVPDALRFDNGRDWLCDALTKACQALGVMAGPVTPYAPEQKPKIERWFCTLDQEFTSQQPYYDRGPRRIDRSHYRPPCEPVFIDRFAAELDDYIHSYNTQRSHRGLDGQTPLERWNQNAPPLRAALNDELAWLLESRTNRKVLKDGIHHDGRTYTAPEVTNIVGATVEIRFAPNDPNTIEVFRDGKWLATAVPRDTASPELRKRVLNARKEGRPRATQLRRKATRAEFRQIDPPTDVEHSDAQTSDGAIGNTRAPLQRTDLLGLDVDEDQL